MSRFVSGGTAEEPVERDEAWLKVQQELEDKRRKKEEESRQQGGKSLYETLQANKAAKQDAFEESIRLKNQFRSLDEDEIDFLDSVLESTRAKEAAVRKETAEQLELFRLQQEQTEKALQSEIPIDKPAPEDSWTVGNKKRKRLKDKGVLPGVKLRKSSSTTETPLMLGDQTHKTDVQDSKFRAPEATLDPDQSLTPTEKAPQKVLEPPKSLTPPPPPAAGLGLGDYSSDED